MFRSTLAVGASAAALVVMVLTSLLLVSLASARPGVLVPAAVSRTGFFPEWLAGPTGALTSWFTASRHTERVIFTVAIATMLVAYLVVIYSARRLRPMWVLVAIVALHVIFFLSPPLNLTDIFNYLNYGRMEAVHHLNPYTTIPALEPHSDPTFLRSNWHGLLSPYGPLFTLFTMGLVPFGVAGSLWAMKATLMLASLGTVFLVYRCAQLLGRNALAAAVIVGINPIVLCGTARRMRLALGLVTGFAAMAAMTLVAFGPNLPNVGQQARLLIAFGIPNLVGYALGFGGETEQMRTVLAVLLVAVVAGCSIWAWRTRRWLTQCGWTTLALILTLSWTLPWYIAWLLPFTALARSRGLRIGVVLLGVYIYLAWMPYSADVLSFIHLNPTDSVISQQAQSFMNSLLF